MRSIPTHYFVLAASVTWGAATLGCGPGSTGGGNQGAAGGSSMGGSGGTPINLPPPVTTLKISEIMYHPVAENAPVDNHEFIELYNQADADQSLDGWRMGGVGFTFPAGAKVPAKGYLVVAKNKTELLKVTRWNLGNGGNVIGDYPGELSNRGERVSLIDPHNRSVEAVEYGQSLPWPAGADALGASERWLPQAWLCPNPDPRNPLGCHQYMGRSLERINLDLPPGPQNFAASEIDAATPGRPNSVAAAALPAIALGLSVAPPAGAGQPIGANNEVTIQVAFSSAVTGAQVEYFVDNVEATNETPLAVNAAPVPGMENTVAATIPGQAGNSVVRYRVKGDRGDGKGAVVISPLPSDPFTHHAYFVRPAGVPATADTMHMFIPVANWKTLERNVQDAHVGARTLQSYTCTNGTLNTAFQCNMNPRWDQTVPAVIVYTHKDTPTSLGVAAGVADTLGVVDKVIDAHVRYQGSTFNRANGRCFTVRDNDNNPAMGTNVANDGDCCDDPNVANCPGWNTTGFPPETALRPLTRPTVACNGNQVVMGTQQYRLRALSWHVDLPRYAQLPDGRTDIRLNKLVQACTGLNTAVGGRIFEKAGIPSSWTRWLRFYVNGSYYRYMMEWERPGDLMIDRAMARDVTDAQVWQSAKVADAIWSGHQLGDFFKVNGARRVVEARGFNEGPIGRGDGLRIAQNAECPTWSVSQRFAATFSRKTHNWKGEDAPNPQDGVADEVKDLWDKLNTAREADVAAGQATWANSRAFFAEHFHLELLQRYMAIVSWMGPWDDYWQNQFLYRFTTKEGKAKWMVYPWDMDLWFGTCRPGRECTFFGGGIQSPAASFFIGEKDNCDNRAAKGCGQAEVNAGQCTAPADGRTIGWWWSPFKDTYFKAYREEQKAMLAEMVKPGGPLETAYVNKLVDDLRARYDYADAAMAASRPFLAYCDNWTNGGAVPITNQILQDSQMKAWTRTRNDRVTGANWDGPRGYQCPANSGQ